MGLPSRINLNRVIGRGVEFGKRIIRELFIKIQLPIFLGTVITFIRLSKETEWYSTKCY